MVYDSWRPPNPDAWKDAFAPVHVSPHVAENYAAALCTLEQKRITFEVEQLLTEQTLARYERRILKR
jgi:hypothetical protein